MKTLAQYRRDEIHSLDGCGSQSGEEGVLKEIFWRLHITDGYFVDCGSNDFAEYSNTRVFADNGWRGLLMEKDHDTCGLATRACQKYDGRVRSLQVDVLANKEFFDNVLGTYQVPYDYDLLDMDIDGPDYFVWRDHVLFEPKVVCIEIAHFCGTDTELIHDQWPEDIRCGSWWNAGTSFKPMLELGQSKGYTLVANTRINMIFVRNDLVPMLRIPQEELDNPNAMYVKGLEQAMYNEHKKHGFELYDISKAGK